MKKMSFILCLFIFYAHLSSSAQQLDWAISTGGIFKVAVDGQGNSISIGTFSDTANVDLDPGPGTFMLPGDVTSHGDGLFILKLGPGGAFKWARQILTNLGAPGCAMALDTIGNIYLCGSFVNSGDFLGTTLNASGLSSDIYILRIDTAGNLDWLKKIGSGAVASDHGYAVAATGDGIVATGWLGGAADVDPGVGVVTASNGWLMLKLDFSGNYSWHRQAGGTSLAINEAGVIYTAGPVLNSWQYDLCKYDSAGQIVWTRSFTDIAPELAADVSGVYATGVFRFTPDFDPGPGTHIVASAGDYDNFVLKLDPDGQYKWVVIHGSAGFDSGLDIQLDHEGGIYVTGFFEHTIDFDPSSNIDQATADSNDIFIQKLDTMGNHLWVKVITGPSDDRCHSIALDTANSIYLAGYGDNADLDPGGGVVSFPAANLRFDGYLAKWNLPFAAAVNNLSATKPPVVIYPNPSNGKLVVSSTEAISQLIAYDVTGRLVHFLQHGSKQSELSIETNGVYFIHITTKDGSFIEKVVVNR
ncbi:MAG TPA: T9SS type A sorting domain-containing protein [Flavipsychrobacter sp.]|nr:T9SS type A sorting domain-containing protein [Flavipsychrobacter sp.]